ncbi:MAG: catechol 1,2-dioxygenase [Myxococcota bacterium]
MQPALHERVIDEQKIRQDAKSHHNPRVAEIVETLQASILDGLQTANVTHAEFKAGIKFLGGVQAAKEIPLLLMVFLEAKHIFGIDEHKEGSQGTVLGPYFRDTAPELTRPYKLPMRSDEPGEPLKTTLTITDTTGKPIDNARISMWQADNFGAYSGFHGEVDEENLRGVMYTDGDGKIEVESVRPGPYPIPDKGPTGKILGALGRHSWRPAHLHFVITKDGYEPLTAQLYFKGGQWVDSDCVHGVRDSLVIEPAKKGDAWTIDHTFALRSA